ncbi:MULTISPECIES: VOC family protein [Hydrogenophaga]|uniref:Glyoxalase n=1 Tax=Hydrogenophaga crocea TaxID=2716225 RepID=A0A6G8IF53_9BURK|nr:VOC family protein [Hydrogenophaga crocea]QIM51741.1 glyoxalase [Hydrogenophaga crocea]
MPELQAIELKPFVPASDFDLSLRFYQEVGFTASSAGQGVAYLKLQGCAFLLQDFYEPGLADNLMLHLLVPDVDAWHRHMARDALQRYFGVRVGAVTQQPWGMTEFVFWDPSGVLWRVGQAT